MLPKRVPLFALLVDRILAVKTIELIVIIMGFVFINYINIYIYLYLFALLVDRILAVKTIELIVIIMGFVKKFISIYI